jgi:hypothetical protein
MQHRSSIRGACDSLVAIMAPPEPPQSPYGGRELTSWKEIADYLGVAVRTAQKWESERALPVRRLPGPARGRVIVTESELSAWKLRGSSPLSNPSEPIVRWRTAALIFAIAAIAGIAAWSWRALTPPHRDPFSARIDGRVLIVTDSHGQELWQVAFPYPAAQRNRPDSPPIWVGDLDGDGAAEVLYAHIPTHMTDGGSLYCYSAAGRERWRFVPGHRVSTRIEAFDPPFWVEAFSVFGPDHGPKRIVLTSHHYLYYPNQVALLSADGKLVREYWHSGWLEHVAVGPFGDNVESAAYLTGISNSYRQAVLVVLDLERMGGASREENADYQLLGVGPALEQARVLFPRSCINRLAHPQNAAHFVFLLPDSVVIEVLEEYDPREAAAVFWHFAPRLSRYHVTLSDGFRGRHHELEDAGKLRHAIKDDQSEFSSVRFLTRP